MPPTTDNDTEPGAFDRRFIRAAAVPATAELRLPRALMTMVLDIGEKLLKLDRATSRFVVNGDIALAVAKALHDNDEQVALEWLATLEREYNAYLEDILKNDDGTTVSWVP